jgi:hypothetical protein
VTSVRPFVFVVLVLVATGCTAPREEPPPEHDISPLDGTPAADPGWTNAPRVEEVELLTPDEIVREGSPEGWSVRWTPGNLTGRAGETARLQVDVIPPAHGVGEAYFAVPQWARESRGLTDVPVPANGTSFTLDVLMGPAAALGAYLRVAEGEECCAYGTLQGPPLGLLPGGEAARAVAKDEVRVALPGLRADANATHVFGVWTYRTTGEHDCDERARAAGTPVLRDGVLHVFVASGSSDACIAPAPARTPRVEFDAGPLAPGDYEVRVHVIESCFCQLQSWRTDAARVTAG